MVWGWNEKASTEFFYVYIFFLLTSFATLSPPFHLPHTIFSIPSHHTEQWTAAEAKKKSESENLTLRWWFYENVKGVVDVLCCVLKSERKNFHSCSCYSASFYGQAFPIFLLFLSPFLCVYLYVQRPKCAGQLLTLHISKICMCCCLLMLPIYIYTFVRTRSG